MVCNLICFESGPAKLDAGGAALNLRNHSLQGVAVIGPTQQGFGAKFIWLMDLTLADAFHLRRVQGMGLGQGLASSFPEYLHEACFFVSFYPSSIK